MNASMSLNERCMCRVARDLIRFHCASIRFGKVEVPATKKQNALLFLERASKNRCEVCLTKNEARNASGTPAAHSGPPLAIHLANCCLSKSGSNVQKNVTYLKNAFLRKSVQNNHFMTPKVQRVAANLVRLRTAQAAHQPGACVPLRCQGAYRWRELDSLPRLESCASQRRAVVPRVAFAEKTAHV